MLHEVKPGSFVLPFEICAVFKSGDKVLNWTYTKNGVTHSDYFETETERDNALDVLVKAVNDSQPMKIE
jgi:hypothetical protein